MDDVVISDTVSVLPIRVETANCVLMLVETVIIGADIEFDTRVLPVRVENVILLACNVLAVNVERFVN
jgi:hypothetical protein